MLEVLKLNRYNNISLNNQWTIHQIILSEKCLFCANEIKQSSKNTNYILYAHCPSCTSKITFYNDNYSFMFLVGSNDRYHLTYDYIDNTLIAYKSTTEMHEGHELFELKTSLLNLSSLDLLIFKYIQDLDFYS